MVAAASEALELQPDHSEARLPKSLALERLDAVKRDADVPGEPAKARDKATAPAPQESGRKCRCPKCGSESVPFRRAD